MGLNGEKVKCPRCGCFVSLAKEKRIPVVGTVGKQPEFWKPDPSEPPASIEESKRWLAKYKKEVLDAR